MSLDNKKGINLNSGFKLLAESPLDVRSVVDTEAEKEALVTAHAAYTGMIVYVKESKRTYQYNSDGTWEFFTKGKEYVHPTGDGNLHVPATGSNSNGRFLVAGDQPGKMTWAEVIPSTIGAADRVHTHKKADITDFPTTLKNPEALKINFKGKTKYTYDGSSARSVNITPDAIGASAEGHTHLYAGSASVGGVANSALKLSSAITLSLSNMVSGSATLDGSKDIDIPIKLNPIDASLVQSGVFDIARIPKAALERCVVVANDTARFALTTDQIQIGDTVKVSDTGKMYFVIDEDNLNNDKGYEIYTAGSASSVPWSGITDKPTEYQPAAHTHKKADITDFPDTLKNPQALKVNFNGKTKYTYDGSSAKTINITADAIGAAASSHTHNYAGSSSAGGAANSVANPITLLLDNVSQGAYNGSSSKEVNITPEAINASRNNHTHTISDISGISDATVSAAKSFILETTTGSKNVSIHMTDENIDSSNLILKLSQSTTDGAHDYTGYVVDAANTLSVKHASTADSATSATNASTADKLNKALIIQLGGISQGSWDGSENKVINITPLAIGAATASHTHNYIPLSGSSGITGDLIPQENNKYNIGLPTKNWNYGYFDNVVTRELSATSACVNGDLAVDGDITANKVYNAVWNADYAEAFEFEGPIPKVGDIVELCGKRKVKIATDGSMAIGVVSDSYCILAGSAISDVKNGFKVAVGLLGQIEVNCRGEINTGDFIVSSFDGVGVSSSDPARGTIIGRAMESKVCLGVEKVMCLVMPQ